jgi:hypothetical protein
MTKDALPKRRSFLVNTPEGMEFIIPTRKNWLVTLLGFLWMCGWLLGGKNIIQEIISPGDGLYKGFKYLLMAMLVPWGFAVFYMGFTWLWTFLGKEHIILRPDALIIKSAVFNIGRTREYEITNIQNMRVDSLDYDHSALSILRQLWSDIGIIAFEYKAKTCRCGNGIDESEASDIVEQLRTRYDFTRNNNAR